MIPNATRWWRCLACCAGPVGSGRAEVPAAHCCDARWMSPKCPVLQTSGGLLCQAPSVQCWKVTLHKAQGLQNLHVDPLAAAAAAAVMNRLVVALAGCLPLWSAACCTVQSRSAASVTFCSVQECCKEVAVQGVCRTCTANDGNRKVLK
jgi:hypothetical protein